MAGSPSLRVYERHAELVSASIDKLKGGEISPPFSFAAAATPPLVIPAQAGIQRIASAMQYYY